MGDCVHHWRQAEGDLKAPFTCRHCGAEKVIETDFYRLFEARNGRPWARSEDRGNSKQLDLQSVGPLVA